MGRIHPSKKCNKLPFRKVGTTLIKIISFKFMKAMTERIKATRKAREGKMRN